MSVKFGLLTNPAKSILEEMEEIHSLGFDYVETGIELPGGSPKIISQNKKKIVALIKKFEYPSIAHTAWWIDFGNGYESVRRGWVDEAKRSIDAAHSIGIKKINFHFYSIGLKGQYKEYHSEILNNIIKSLKEIVSYASSKKIMVFLENAPEKRSILGIREYNQVIESIPNLRVHVDIGHALVEHGMKGVKDYLFTFKDKLEHIHLHDNSGNGDEHLPLGDGILNSRQLAKWLKEIGYDKTITMEVFTNRQDAKRSMLYFKELLSKKV